MLYQNIFVSSQTLKRTVHVIAQMSIIYITSLNLSILMVFMSWRQILGRVLSIWTWGLQSGAAGYRTAVLLETPASKVFTPAPQVQGGTRASELLQQCQPVGYRDQTCPWSSYTSQNTHVSVTTSTYTTSLMCTTSTFLYPIFHVQYTAQSTHLSSMCSTQHRVPIYQVLSIKYIHFCIYKYSFCLKPSYCHTNKFLPCNIKNSKSIFES